MPPKGYKRTAESIEKFKRTMAKKTSGKRKKRKYERRMVEPDAISVSGAIMLLRKAKKAMTMEDLAPKDLYVILALQELQGSI